MEDGAEVVEYIFRAEGLAEIPYTIASEIEADRAANRFNEFAVETRFPASPALHS